MSHSDYLPDGTQDPFGEELAALLARTAQDAQPNPDLARQVRERLSAGDGRRAPRLFDGYFPWLASLGSVAVVALLLVAFAAVLVGRGVGHLGPGGATTASPTAAPTSTMGSASTQACEAPGNSQGYSSDPNPPLSFNPVDHSVPVGVSVTDKGFTVTIDRAYADATQTVVTLSVSPDDSYTLAPATLADAAGTRYQSLMSGADRLPNNHILNTMIFAPLPQSELGRPQRLTLFITTLFSTAGGGPSSTPPPMLAGKWTIPFTIMPVAGTAISLSLPAQTHDGVTIQIEEIDVAPAGGGLDGQSGGARVRFRISNLPATALLTTASQYPTWFTYATAESFGGGGGGGAPSGAACHDSLTLTLASGVKLTPGAIIPLGQIVPITPGYSLQVESQTVGASGSVEAEALFFTPIPRGNVTLTINLVQVSAIRDGKQALLRTAQGPWALTAPVK